MKTLVAVVAVIVAGCATDVAREAATLTPPASGAPPQQIAIAQDTEVPVSGTYTRVLVAGSRWQLVGSVPQGNVYRRADGVFTVEGAHVHEAFLVLTGDRLVGYYLPVEKAYSPATPVQLKLQ